MTSEREKLEDKRKAIVEALVALAQGELTEESSRVVSIAVDGLEGNISRLILLGALREIDGDATAVEMERLADVWREREKDFSADCDTAGSNLAGVQAHAYSKCAGISRRLGARRTTTAAVVAELGRIADEFDAKAEWVTSNRYRHCIAIVEKHGLTARCEVTTAAVVERLESIARDHSGMAKMVKESDPELCRDEMVASGEAWACSHVVADLGLPPSGLEEKLAQAHARIDELEAREVPHPEPPA